MYKYTHAEKMIITNEELYLFLEKKGIILLSSRLTLTDVR